MAAQGVWQPPLPHAITTFPLHALTTFPLHATTTIPHLSPMFFPPTCLCEQGLPPRSNIHPMRVLFMISREPSPTLEDPEKWSLLFHDFVAKCLIKEPKQRPTTPALLQHKFIERCKDTAVVLKKRIDQAKAMREEAKKQRLAAAALEEQNSVSEDRCKDTAVVLKKRIDQAKAIREEAKKQRLAAAALEEQNSVSEDVSNIGSAAEVYREVQGHHCGAEEADWPGQSDAEEAKEQRLAAAVLEEQNSVSEDVSSPHGLHTQGRVGDGPAGAGAYFVGGFLSVVASSSRHSFRYSGPRPPPSGQTQPESGSEEEDEEEEGEGEEDEANEGSGDDSEAPNNKAWLVVTSHWIDENFYLRTMVLEFREMLGRHGGKEMAQGLSKTDKRKVESQRLTDADWETLQAVKTFLSPFAKVSKAAEGAAYPTVSMVVPYYNGLIDAMESRLAKGPSPTLQPMIVAALSHLKKYAYITSNEYWIATFLDPSMKAAWFDDAHWEKLHPETDRRVRPRPASGEVIKLVLVREGAVRRDSARVLAQCHQHADAEAHGPGLSRHPCHVRFDSHPRQRIGEGRRPRGVAPPEFAIEGEGAEEDDEEEEEGVEADDTAGGEDVVVGSSSGALA
ncbi:unnamed protein product [Closterium sp. NIES-54]